MYNMGSTTVYQTSDEGNTESNGGFLFNLTDVSGNNLTSTATVNITSNVTITCSATGVADDPNNVELTILVLGESTHLSLIHWFIHPNLSINPSVYLSIHLSIHFPSI